MSIDKGTTILPSSLWRVKEKGQQHKTWPVRKESVSERERERKKDVVLVINKNKKKNNKKTIEGFETLASSKHYE